jgi:hypothetical protein
MLTLDSSSKCSDRAEKVRVICTSLSFIVLFKVLRELRQLTGRISETYAIFNFLGLLSFITKSLGNQLNRA